MKRSSQRILILGATSAIADAAARRWASRGGCLYLVGREQGRLDVLRQDYLARGASTVAVRHANLDETEPHQEVIEGADRALGELDLALIAYGVLPDQAACERDWEPARKALVTNFVSVTSLLTHLSNYFETRRKGTIAVLGSVAGDRGRKRNYVYGSAKGGLDVFLQGLRHRLADAGVTVLTVKPGLVDTPMTAELAKTFLFASPAQVGGGIVRAVDRNQSVVYLPWFWRPIMAVIQAMPAPVFHRLNL